MLKEAGCTSVSPVPVDSGGLPSTLTSAAPPASCDERQDQVPRPVPHSTVPQGKYGKLSFEGPVTIRNTFIDLHTDDEQPSTLHTDGTQTCDASFFYQQAEESSIPEVWAWPPLQSSHDSQVRCLQTAMPHTSRSQQLPAVNQQQPATTMLVLQVPIEVECGAAQAMMQQALQHVETVVRSRSIDPASGRQLLDLQVALGLPQPSLGNRDAAQQHVPAASPAAVMPLAPQANASAPLSVALPGGFPPSKGSGRSPVAETSPGSSPLVCCHWKNKGFCRYTDSCKFQHPPHKRGIGLQPAAGSSHTAGAPASATRRRGRQR